MRKTLILDSTQIDNFLTCPMQWELGNIALLQLNGYDMSSMDMGSFGHKLLEGYYKGISNNMTPEAAYKSVLVNLPIPRNPLPQEIIDAVLLKFQWYWLRYMNRPDIIPTKIGERPLVEIGFSYPLLDTPEYLFVLEGMIDLIGLMDGMKVFMDHKFQGRKTPLYKKSIQFKNYALVTNSYLGCINYIRLADKLDESTFERSMMSFNPQFLKAWKEELIEIFIKVYNSTLENKREQRWSSCGGKYNKLCQFTSICEEFNPSIKSAIIESKYHTIERWEPWIMEEKLVL